MNVSFHNFLAILMRGVWRILDVEPTSNSVAVDEKGPSTAAGPGYGFQLADNNEQPEAPSLGFRLAGKAAASSAAEENDVSRFMRLEVYQDLFQAAALHTTAAASLRKLLTMRLALVYRTPKRESALG